MFQGDFFSKFHQYLVLKNKTLDLLFLNKY